MSNFGLSPKEINYARNTYELCAELVDDQVRQYNSERDDTPLYMRALLGNRALADQVTVRFNVNQPPPRGSCPPPYAEVLEKTPVIAFQKLDRRRIGLGEYRKIELLDPFSALGGVTLLMVGLEESERQNPEMPACTVSGSGIDAYLATPLYDRDLTDNLRDFTRIIKGLNQARQLTPISFDDIQAMYSLQADLDQLG